MDEFDSVRVIVDPTFSDTDTEPRESSSRLNNRLDAMRNMPIFDHADVREKAVDARGGEPLATSLATPASTPTSTLRPRIAGLPLTEIKIVLAVVVPTTVALLSIGCLVYFFATDD
jgi:hypothetical protein